MTRALVIAIVCAALPALAQPVQEAKQHFKAGKTLQDAGKYAEAAVEYQAAYDLDPRPPMLFNIAQAHRLASHKQVALDFYKRYLAAEPDGAGAREARQWITELQHQLEAERPLPTQPEPSPPLPQPPPDTSPRPPAETPPIAPAKSSRTLRIAGLAVGGAGAVTLGLGVAFGLKARSAADEITGHKDSWTQAEKDTFEAGQRANRNMIIAYVVGGAMVATGGVLYTLGARAHVAPVAGPRTAGLVVQGRF